MRFEEKTLYKYFKKKKADEILEKHNGGDFNSLVKLALNTDDKGLDEFFRIYCTHRHGACYPLLCHHDPFKHIPFMYVDYLYENKIKFPRLLYESGNLNVFHCSACYGRIVFDKKLNPKGILWTIDTLNTLNAVLRCINV